MKVYIAFSIHGTNVYITANRKLDIEDIKEGFSFANSRNPFKTNSDTKLHWDKLITKKGQPLRSPALILHFFKELEKDGWIVDKQNFVKRHYCKH